jgi:hypothetical protein
MQTILGKAMGELPFHFDIQITFLDILCRVPPEKQRRLSECDKLVGIICTLVFPRLCTRPCARTRSRSRSRLTSLQ